MDPCWELYGAQWEVPCNLCNPQLAHINHVLFEWC